MESGVLKVRVAAAIAVAAGLSLASGGAVLAHSVQEPAAQTPAAPAAQADGLKLTQNVPHLIIWGVKASKSADFEATWKMIQDQFAKSERPEVKEFAATFGKSYKVDLGPAPPEAPSVYVFEINTPSMTQSYNPGKIIYEFLWTVKDGKETGIPRADADAIFAKLGNMQEMFTTVNTWPLKKMGS